MQHRRVRDVSAFVFQVMIKLNWIRQEREGRIRPIPLFEHLHLLSKANVFSFSFSVHALLCDPNYDSEVLDPWFSPFHAVSMFVFYIHHLSCC